MEKQQHGLTVEAVQKLVDDFLAEYNGNIPVTPVIKEKQEDIYGPRASREAIGYRFDGAYHPARHLFALAASNMGDKGAARRALRHELLGHYGLNTFKPAEKRRILHDVLETEAEPSLSHVWHRVKRDYADKSPRNQAEEVFAFVAEEERSFFGRSWDKVRASFQKALRVTGLADGPLTLHELREAALDVAEGIRKGVRIQQTFPMSDHAQFSRVKEDQYRQAERADWGDFPAVVRNADLKSLESEPEYLAAKAGDREAAFAMVDRVLTDETVEGVRRLLGDRRDVRITPVLAEEASGRNKIPLMMAEVLAHRLGVEVEYGICQVERVHRTGSTADHRLAFSPTFDGEVEPGRLYFIVDDTLAMGGTVAALRGYIVNRGGHVPGAAVMTAHEGAVNLPASQNMLDGIRAKHGDAMNHYWKEEFGYGIDQLTQAEAGHLRAAASVDAIRTRIAAARDAAGWPVGQADAGPQDSGLTLTGFDRYREAQISRAQQAFDHAHDAFWDCGDALPAIRAEIEQKAHAEGVEPRALLATVFSDEPPLAYAQRITDAIAASPEAQTLEKSVRHARRHLDKQLRRTPGPALAAEGDECALDS